MITLVSAIWDSDLPIPTRHGIALSNYALRWRCVQLDGDDGHEMTRACEATDHRLRPRGRSKRHEMRVRQELFDDITQ